MLPPFDTRGLLPAGLHWSEWPDLMHRFGQTPHRQWLLGGLLRALRNLAGAGCKTAYVDGSFVTAAERPKDYDACWELQGVALERVDPVLKVFDHGRALQKLKYFGELFPCHMRADRNGRPFLEFFQSDKTTGEAKGIVALRLEGLPND